ncbi:hypothetical protein [Bradyrhizobium sp. G127]|uniref:hypothetical protein n=1 Tax=Bradyrhizobium sp. G127 TaxID=2904800 RepID=UPI001F3275C7|nr:hypothetical protein [Bradyrhizobium sp. G127]MCF2524440.1 hypothetical protein [Bradyrhizobium sp. G127]
MKILAISYCLPPMAYPQAVQIGRLLSYSKMQVCAVSGGNNVDVSGFGAHVEHHVVPLNEKRGFLERIATRAVPFYGTVPDVYRGWVDAAYKQVEALIANSGKPDLVATFGEPMSDHLLGLRLKKTFNMPWLAHFSDPWSDNPFRRLQVLSKPVNCALESRVLKQADVVVFTSSETVDLVFKKYDAALRRKAFLLSHAYDPTTYGVQPNGSPSGPIMMRYIGNFYGHRTPKPLIAALAELQRNEPHTLHDVRVELVGGIPPRMMLSPEWKLLPPGLLVARGSVSYVESLCLMKTSDILLTIDAPADLSVFFPSKLADYIGARRRLVGIVPPGTAARIIRECGGRWISPGAPTRDIACLIRDEIAAARAQRADVHVPAQPEREDNRYAIANVAPVFDDLCRKTIEISQAWRVS